MATPLIQFGISSSLNSSDTYPNTEDTFGNGFSRTESEIRPNIVRRNSEGDVKVVFNDETLVGSSGTRDDSDLYFTKSLVCKSDNSVSPSKALLVNGLDRLSNQNIGGCYEDATVDQERNILDSGFENNSIDGIKISTEDLENRLLNPVDQNETSDDGKLSGVEISAFDQNDVPGQSDEFADSMSSSSNTIIEESNKMNKANSDIENGPLISKSSAECSRTASKAINCSSSHRMRKVPDTTFALQNFSRANHFESGGTLLETRWSPRELSSNKLSKYIDIDGLSLITDPVQERLVKLERCYREKIERLETQLQEQGCVCDPRHNVNIKEDPVS